MGGGWQWHVPPKAGPRALPITQIPGIPLRTSSILVRRGISFPRCRGVCSGSQAPFKGLRSNCLTKPGSRPRTARLALRVPEALKADLQDAALDHGISLSEEVLRRLKRPRPQHLPMHPETFRQLMELEPLASDPDVTIEEVVRRMEEINPYQGERA